MVATQVEEIQTKLRARGYRLTPQRRAVLQALVGRTNHPTAEEIFQEVQAQFPMVARSTIYDTLETLVKVGECVELFPEVSARRFDPDVSPHSHFICTSCRGIFDLEVLPPPLDPAVFRRRGFQVHRQVQEFYGLCSECQSQKRSF